MARCSDPRLLVLHGVRLVGVSEPAGVAEVVGMASRDVAGHLVALAADGRVERCDGALPGWRLTTTGRAEHALLLAGELDVAGARAEVAAAYATFVQLNRTALDACSRWQVRTVGGRLVRNDHADPAHDRAVLCDLGALHARARPLCDRLAAALDRYGIYGRRLGHALARIRAGETGFVAKPSLASYHTVWFELHEDLLLTLGLDRAGEASHRPPSAVPGGTS